MLSLEEHDELIAEMFQELDDDLFYFYMENESLQQSEMSDASGSKEGGDTPTPQESSQTQTQTTDANAKNNDGAKMFDRVVQFFSRLMRQIQTKIQNGKIQELYKQIENINTPAVSMKDYWWFVLKEAYDNFTSKEQHAQTAVFNTFEQLLKSDVNIYQKFDKTKVKEYQAIYSAFKELAKAYNNSDTKNDIENTIKTSPRKEHPTNEVKNMISTIMKYQTKLLEKLQGTNNFINQQKSSLSDEDKGSQEFKWYVAAITEGLKSLNMSTSIIINAFKDILSGVSANNGNNQNNQNPQQQPQQTQQQQTPAPPPEVTTNSFYFNNDFDNIVQEGGFIRPTSSGSGYRYSPHDTTFDDKATFKKLQSLYENLFYLKRETRHMTKSECVNKLIRSFNILAEIYDVIEEDYTEPEQARRTSRLGFARKQEHQSKHRDRIDSLILEIRHNIIEVAGRGWSRDGVRRIVDKMLVVYEYEAQELDSTKHFGDRIRSTGIDKVRNKLFKMMMDSSVEVIDDELFMEGKLSTEQRKQLKDKQYGIPSLRKYPLTDETHVLQAVRFFSKAPEEYKEELARNIVKRAKELNMAWEQWDVLKPYLDESVQEATMIQCSDDREIDIPAGPDKMLTVDSKDWDMIIKEYPEVKDKTVKAGSLLYRITNRKESIGTKRKYVTLTRADALKYTDPKHGIVDNKSSAKIAVYKLKKELKIAGADAVLDILEKIYHKSEFGFDDIKYFSFLKPDSRIVSELNKQGYGGLFDPMDIVFAKTATVIFNPKDIIELDHYDSLDDDDDITQEAFTDIKFKEDIPHDKHDELFDHPTWKQLQSLYDKIHNYKVGIPNSHGKVKEQSEKKIEKHYHFLSPQEFEKYKGGLSLDYNEYVRDYCEQRNIDFKQFYIITETKPTITHTLTIVPLPDLDQYALIHFGFDAFGDNTSELLAAELTVIKKDVDGSETESKLTLKRALEIEFDRLTRTMFRLKTVKKHYHQFKYSVFQYKGRPRYGSTKEECMDWMSQHGQYFCDGMARDQKYQNRSYQESFITEQEEDGYFYIIDNKNRFENIGKNEVCIDEGCDDWECDGHGFVLLYEDPVTALFESLELIIPEDMARDVYSDIDRKFSPNASAIFEDVSYWNDYVAGRDSRTFFPTKKYSSIPKELTLVYKMTDIQYCDKGRGATTGDVDVYFYKIPKSYLYRQPYRKPNKEKPRFPGHNGIYKTREYVFSGVEFEKHAIKLTLKGIHEKPNKLAGAMKNKPTHVQESAVSVNELKQMTGEVYQQALQIKYGCLNEDGERITASPFQDSWKMIVDYHSQSIQSIEESKLGCCFEHAFYVGNLLKQKDLPYQVFFLNVNIQNEEIPEIPITFWHQFTIVPNDADSVVLIETSLTPDKNGVFLVRDMEDAVQHLINSFNITLTDEQKESMKQDLIDVTNMDPVDGDTYLGMIDNIYKNGKAIKDEIRIGHRNEMMITFFNFMHEKQFLNEDGEKLYAQLDNFDPDTPFEIYALMSFKDHLFNEQGISFIDESGLLEPETFFDLTPKEMESKLNGFVQESYMENHHNKLKADYKYIPLTPKYVKQYAPQGSFKVGLQHVRVTKDTHGAIYIDNSDVVVGYVAIEKKANGERWITALEVSTEYQTKGFGTDLLQIAVDEFHADHLTVNRDNDRALQMYLKHGWVVSDTSDKMYFMKLNNGDDTNEIN
jgi:ribosomal protein S18 acetylase RimI-like enzyme